MPTYTYECPAGHVTELVMPMADDKPERVPCEHVPQRVVRVEHDDPADVAHGRVVLLLDGVEARSSRFSGDTCGERVAAAMNRLDVMTEALPCGLLAGRVFHAPVAVHWDGTGGSYHEDSYRNDSGRYGWKRRANAGDDLPVAGL